MLTPVDGWRAGGQGPEGWIRVCLLGTSDPHLRGLVFTLDWLFQIGSEFLTQENTQRPPKPFQMITKGCPSETNSGHLEGRVDI